MSLRERHFEEVERTFADAYDTMLGKNHDYATEDNPYSNFEFAALAAGITVEQGFLFLLGVKMARLKELLVADKEPANESVEDTLEDAINYNAILKSFRRLKQTPAKETGYEDEPDYLNEEPIPEPGYSPVSANWLMKFLTAKKV